MQVTPSADSVATHQRVRLYDAPPPPPLRRATTTDDAFVRLPTVYTEQPRDNGEVYFSSVQVVDSRINYSDEGRRFVEYKLEIDTDSRGVLYAWHRYSMFLDLVYMLQLRDGYQRRGSMPKLPSKRIFGNFAEATISARVEKLNEFLAAATGPEFREWGIRVDNGTCVYMRSAKSSGSRDSMTSNASTTTTGSSPRRQLSRRFSLKSFSFRRGSTAN